MSDIGDVIDTIDTLEQLQEIESFEEFKNQVFSGLANSIASETDNPFVAAVDFLDSSAAVGTTLTSLARNVANGVAGAAAFSDASNGALDKFDKIAGGAGFGFTIGKDILSAGFDWARGDTEAALDGLYRVGMGLAFSAAVYAAIATAGIAIASPIALIATGYALGTLIYDNFDTIASGFDLFVSYLEAEFGELLSDPFGGLQEFLSSLFDALNTEIDWADPLIDLFGFMTNRSDPLIIDLDGDGVNTTPAEGSSTTFDLDNNGTEETVGWFEAEDGAIAHDWKGTSNADESVSGNGRIQDRSELFATFGELSRHDVNGDGVLDANDVAVAADTDANGDGVIDENDRVQPTATGDFDGNGTLETIAVGWDQLQVWIDADSDGNTDDGELHSFEDLGITSIDLNATTLNVENNDNIINSESTVTFEDGTSSVVNGVDFNRDTLNQSYQPQIDALDLSPEYLVDRLDVFTLPQLQGVGNVPHLMIAALADDDVLNAWRAMANFEGDSASEFRGLVEDLLLTWSGGDDLAQEYRGTVPGSILNAIEEFLGVEYPRPDETLRSFAQTELALDAWGDFVNAVTVRFFVQLQGSDNPDYVSYDFTQDQFSGNWLPLLDRLQDAYTAPDLTAVDKTAITDLLSGIFSITAAEEGNSQDLSAAGFIEDLFTEINVPTPFNDVLEEFVIGYSDDLDVEYLSGSSTSPRSGDGVVTVTYYPPGVDYDADYFVRFNGGVSSNGDVSVIFDESRASYYLDNSIQSYSTIFTIEDSDPGRLSDWNGDALLLGGRGADIFDVRDGLLNNGVQTLVVNNNQQGDSTLYVGALSDFQFSRDTDNLFVTNLETNSTVVVQNHFASSVFGVSYVSFGNYGNALVGFLDVINDYDDPSSHPGFLDTAWDLAEIAENAWYRGTDEKDYISGTNYTGDLSEETYLGGLGDDIIVGGAGKDTYVYRLGDGNDTIVDTGLSVSQPGDVLSLVDANRDEVELSKRGNDLIVLLLPTGQEILVQNHFALSNFVLGIEEIVFADGSVLNREEIDSSLIYSGTNTSDLVSSTSTADIIVGGEGDDILAGGTGSDTYFYSSLDGNDVIFDDPQYATSDVDTLRLVDLNAGDIQIERDGDNLTIVVIETGNVITVARQFESGFIANNSNFGLEQLVFANGETWGREEILIRSNAPRVDVAIGEVTIQEDTEWQFEIPENAFVDPDGQSLTFSAELATGDELPDWISFDGNVFTGTPPLNFNGELQIALTASDGTRETASEFTLNIEPVNDAPVISPSLPDVTSPEDQAVNFVLPLINLMDADGDALTVSAALADGSELPSWLIFDPDQRSFSGTPPLNYNGSLAITVTASDGELSAINSFDLVIDPVNDAPTQVLNYGTLNVVAGTRFSFNTDIVFDDVDGDALVFSFQFFEQGEETGPSPDWLTPKLNGEPGSDVSAVIPTDLAAGDYVLRVIASDGVETTFGDILTTILPSNMAPELTTALIDQTSNEDADVSFTIPADTFADIDGDDLMLSATLSDGADLPSWLAFDTQTLTLSGTPPINFNGTLSIDVTASDGEYEVSDTFDLAIEAVNDAPSVSAPIANQSYANGETVSFALPNDAFSDVDGDALIFSASLSDGADIPTWLTFDSLTLEFSGTPPTGFSGVLALEVTASDGSLEANNTFELEVLPVQGDTSGFTTGPVNDYYNPSNGSGGFTATFDYIINENSIVDDGLSAWSIDGGYTGDGTIMNAWATGFPGGASFNAEDGTLGNTSQNYQPELEAGTNFSVTFQVDGAGFDENDFTPEFFDEDPELFLASADDVLIDAAPTNDWGTGFVQNVEVTNTSQTAIDQWSVVLDLPDGGDIQLNNVWGATAQTLENGDIEFSGLSWNESIDPNGTSNFGFVASYSNLDEVQFEDDDFIWGL